VLVVYLGSAAVSQSPVAVVNLEAGPVGAQIVRSIADADVFRVSAVSSRRAQMLYDNLEVAAIITIPVDFSARVRAHARAPLQVKVNNYNLDLTNDIRRAVPHAITVFYQAQGSASPLGITVAEHDLRPKDVQLFQYAVLPLILLLVTVNGVITSGLAASLEWEKKTIKELLLAPCGHAAIILGKVLAGFLTTTLLGALMLAAGAALGWTRPEGPYWLSALLVIALGSLFSSGLGIVGVIFFEPVWLQEIAGFDPLTYAIHALQMAVFYSSSEQIWRDAAVLASTSVAAIALGSLAMRREIMQ
jgi:ABC-2 type transport system permease protein